MQQIGSIAKSELRNNLNSDFLLPDDSFMNDSFLGGDFLGRKLIEYGQLPIYLGFEIKGMFALRRIFQFNRSKTADDRLPGMVV